MRFLGAYHSLVGIKDKKYSKNFDIRIVFHGMVERIMSRYPNGIAYQDLLFDLGHLIAILKTCLSYYGISYTLRTSVSSDSKFNLMELEILTIDIKLSHNLSGNI